jgi:predicted tellurium resistance membrane protein TerC
VKFIGGGYLIFLFLKHAVDFVRHKAGHDVPDIQNWKIFTRLGIPMFVATIIQIELMDLAFALDQVLAAVAFVETYPDPDRYILIIISSVIGIAMLRIAATQIVKVMDWMPTLEHIAYVAVGYVGVKLILTYDGFNPAHGGIHIPNAISIGVTLGLFVIPILIKLIFKWPKSLEIAR